MEEMVQYTKHVLGGLVDDHNTLQVVGRLDEGCLTLDVKAPEKELSRLIGKEGRTARSLRTILGAAGKKFGLRCELNLENQ